MNIRKIGTYEIVLCDSDHKRIKEVVSHGSLQETQKKAEQLVQETDAFSFYVTRVILNTAFDKRTQETKG